MRWTRRVVAGAILMGLLVVGGTAFRVWQMGRVDDRNHAEMIVVLGAAQYNGTPSEVLEARLRHAKRLYDREVAPIVVTAGGKQPGDRFTEGQAGASWMVGHGVPAEDAIAVGEGSDTLSTLRAVSELARERGWRTAVIVSDPWHTMRALEMAGDSGLDAWASPTHTGPIVQTRETQIRYIIRETAALLYYRLSKTSFD